MSVKPYDENFSIIYKDISELSYFDNNKKYITIYVNSKAIGKLEVYTDKENYNREYVIINCELIYLDTMKQIN